MEFNKLCKGFNESQAVLMRPACGRVVETGFINNTLNLFFFGIKLVLIIELVYFTDYFRFCRIFFNQGFLREVRYGYAMICPFDRWEKNLISGIQFLLTKELRVIFLLHIMTS